MATRSLVLKTGDARDVGTVDALMAAAFDPRFGEAWTSSQCLGVLAMPGVRLLIAWDEEVPTGFALWRTIMDEAELLLLAVAPGHRRRGVGGALLRAMIADVAASGVATIHLEVRAGNDAVALYRTAGFAKIGERRGYYRSRDGGQHDAHTYSLAL
ncbi:GNAT family N-acetyltransferase [Sphingomonas rubra]|uniref:Ribosomal-protein-alanine N-acetyltransferase n=1 Tax=Sphingomonas rubra TaxID=634430 RepID=A0A1I5SP32_9SPHN|nr:GNAT family N-acetyltransferase [Sphingomonas rubra]SFP72522.1 ribosomal-protein-alanine N-acetyltransferase [Sphingomonas rubra]